VGIVNTLFGFSLIFSLMFFGLSATVSNAIGYFFGAILSYFLNKKYTFKSTSQSRKEAIKFFTVLFISYIINFLTLQWLLTFLNPYYAQLISAVVYTLSSFILAKFFVFNGDD
jgi:putative flippase GtrA